MNDMRKLMEAMEQVDSEYQSSPPTDAAREYKAFIYGVEWGNSAQYEDGGYQAYELPQAYKDWVEGGRKGYYD